MRLTVHARTTCNSRVAAALRNGPPGTPAERRVFRFDQRSQAKACHAGFLGFRVRDCGTRSQSPRSLRFIAPASIQRVIAANRLLLSRRTVQILAALNRLGSCSNTVRQLMRAVTLPDPPRGAGLAS